MSKLTMTDQAMKLHQYMLKHWHKDVPLHACISALNRAEDAVIEDLGVGEDICFKAGDMIMMAIDELKEYKPKLDS